MKPNSKHLELYSTLLAAATKKRTRKQKTGNKGGFILRCPLLHFKILGWEVDFILFAIAF